MIDWSGGYLLEKAAGWQYPADVSACTWSLLWSWRDNENHESNSQVCMILKKSGIPDSKLYPSTIMWKISSCFSSLRSVYFWQFPSLFSAANIRKLILLREIIIENNHFQREKHKYLNSFWLNKAFGVNRIYATLQIDGYF